MAAAFKNGARYLLLQMPTIGALPNCRAVIGALVLARWMGVCFAVSLTYVLLIKITWGSVVNCGAV